MSFETLIVETRGRETIDHAGDVFGGQYIGEGQHRALLSDANDLQQQGPLLRSGSLIEWEQTS